MANPFFKFKQFTVFHDKCAMKVGTDGVLLGAWADVSIAKNALDIGSGSGLISLMLAQRNTELLIEAIDADADAVLQTEVNTQASPFEGRIFSRHQTLQEFSNTVNKQYDLIVSNPPFFNQSLKSPDLQRTTARHTDSLSLDELISCSAKLLSPNGKFALIYPHSDKKEIVEIGKKHGLYPSKICHVFPTPASVAKRVLIEFIFERKDTEETNLIIEESRHVYTSDFAKLVKDFYLKL